MTTVKKSGPFKAGNGEVLTSGDVAKLCGVASRTVCKWADDGRLKGWRIPGSNDRRFAKAVVFRFMEQHGMRQSPLLLVVSNNPLLVAPALVGGWRTQCAPDLFTAGLHVRGASAVLWDLCLGRAPCLTAAVSLLAACEAEGVPCPLLLALPTDDEAEPDLLAETFDHVLAPGCDLGRILLEANNT